MYSDIFFDTHSRVPSSCQNYDYKQHTVRCIVSTVLPKKVQRFPPETKPPADIAHGLPKKITTILSFAIQKERTTMFDL